MVVLGQYQFSSGVKGRVAEKLFLGYFSEECGFFFLTCPKTLPEAKLKSFGLMVLAEEIVKLYSIDSVMWLFLFTLRRLKRNKLSKEKGKM